MLGILDDIAVFLGEPHPFCGLTSLQESSDCTDAEDFREDSKRISGNSFEAEPRAERSGELLDVSHTDSFKSRQESG
jgi:hypothetical protein